MHYSPLIHRTIEEQSDIKISDMPAPISDEVARNGPPVAGPTSGPVWGDNPSKDEVIAGMTDWFPKEASAYSFTSVEHSGRLTCWMA